MKRKTCSFVFFTNRGDDSYLLQGIIPGTAIVTPALGERDVSYVSYVSWSVKTRRAPSRQSTSRHARAYGQTTTAMNEMNPPHSLAPKKSQTKVTVEGATRKRYRAPGVFRIRVSFARTPIRKPYSNRTEPNRIEPTLIFCTRRTRTEPICTIHRTKSQNRTIRVNPAAFEEPRFRILKNP